MPFITNFALLDIGVPELVLVLAIVLLLFGGRKLPELSKSLGTSLRELRSGLNDDPKKSSSKSKEEDAAR